MTSESPHPLESRLAELPHQPGVYRFLDREGVVLYVGKAKDLRKRVASYFSQRDHPARIRVMLRNACGLETAVTSDEIAALILESNLIKQLQPRYNVLLKDDKSYPYLRLTTDHPFPRLELYRGERQKGGESFGPYPSARAVRETLKWLQRIVPVRQCPDTQFAQRKRPCLQYQIKRCGGPCCGKIDAAGYQRWVAEVRLFLLGKERQLLDGLRQEMWQLAAEDRFEEAALVRDRIRAVEYVQTQRRLNLTTEEDLDLIYAVTQGGRTAVQLFWIRGGINLGNRGFFPEHTEGVGIAEVLQAFITQYYAEHPPPPEILVNQPPAEAAWLMKLLGARLGRAVRIRVPLIGAKQQLLELAATNARQELAIQLARKESAAARLAELATVLGLDPPPGRIEVYDISHHQSTAVVGAMIVYGVEGFRKGEYRRYTIKTPEASDDTARMREMLTRRMRGLVEQPRTEWPEVMVLDGGRGQLNVALEVAEALGITGVRLCALAKGEERKPGEERLFLPESSNPLILPDDSPARFLLQQIRDEAHRFAIGFHRTQSGRERSGSVLDRIAGVGPKRRQGLLRHFGSVRRIATATAEELESAPGITRGVAERIVEFFQSERQRS